MNDTLFFSYTVPHRNCRKLLQEGFKEKQQSVSNEQTGLNITVSLLDNSYWICDTQNLEHSTSYTKSKYNLPIAEKPTLKCWNF
jgi:hypothetical protein